MSTASKPNSRHFKLSPSLRFRGSRVCTLLLVVSFASKPLSGEEAKKKPASAVSKQVSLFDGRTLKNWRLANVNEFELHGKVYVKDGAIVVEKGRPASGIVYTGKPPRTNYEISLDAKRIDGSDFFCGLTFPVSQSYCTLIIGGWGGGATGLSNIDEASAVDNETTGYTEFKQNQWYKIRLRVSKNKIEAWIDEEQIVDLESTDRKFSIWWEQEPARPLGIATWHTTAAFRNLRLHEFGEAKPPLKSPAENSVQPQ